MVLAEELRRAIGAFVRRVREKAEAEKAAQSETLGLLDREGRMNVAALAERRGVTHQTMRVIVAQLEADGLVERSPNPDDRRSQHVLLSPAGAIEVARGRVARASRIAAMIDRTLSVAEREQLGQAIGLLDRLCAARD